MSIGLLLEALVTVLLLVTVGYCFVLNRRLTALRDGRDELKGLIETLSASVTHAQSSVYELKKMGEAADAELGQSVEKAKALGDELTILVELGNNVADRIANGPRVAAPAASGSRPSAAGDVPEKKRAVSDVRSRKKPTVQGSQESQRAAAAPKSSASHEDDTLTDDLGDAELQFIQALREAR